MTHYKEPCIFINILLVYLSVCLFFCMYVWKATHMTPGQVYGPTKMKNDVISYFWKKNGSQASLIFYWFSNQSDLLLGSQTSLIFYLVLKLVWSFTWFSNLSDLLLCSQTSLIFYLVLKLVWSFTWFSNYSDLLLGSQTCLSN